MSSEMFYDEYSGKWYLDLHYNEEKPEKERSCDGCPYIEEYGVDACSGCSG